MFSKQFLQNIADKPTLLEVINWGENSNRSEMGSIGDQAEYFLEGQPIKMKVRVGKPVDEVLAEIREGHYGLVIYGASCYPKSKSVPRKSVAKRLVDQAPCSVLLVRGKKNLVRRILLCDSGFEESQLIDKFRDQIINILGMKEDITVLHVMSQISAGPGVRGVELRAETDELIDAHSREGVLLKRDVAALQKSGIRPLPKIRHGLVVDEIVAEAQSGNYDLVVLGYHRERWQKFLLDDLPHQIIEQVDFPVMVLK